MEQLEASQGKKGIGKSVFAIIQNERGEYLAQYRLKTPVCIALPAGHIDEGEAPEAANVREVFEETGVAVEEQTEVLHRAYDATVNPCGKGHNGHECWVYRVARYSGEPKLCEPTKHKFVGWMKWDGILAYIARGDVDPVWVAIFRDLGMLK